MASSSSSEKRLAEFLKEQQEPFILELYLLERGCSKKWTLPTKSATCSVLSKKRRNHFFPIPPFSKLLTLLHKKLAFHNQSCITVIKVSESDNTSEDEHVSVSVNTDQTVLETDRFSSATSSTLFNSCSDVDDDEDLDMDTCQASSFFNKERQSQQATNHGKHRQRCIEVCVTHEHRIHSCGVIVPKKITEDSVLSAALWSSLIQRAERENYTKELQEFVVPNVSEVLKSKRVLLHKTKQLLFNCVSEITINLPRKQHKGPEEEVGKKILERTKQVANETNYYVNNLVGLDLLDSINEWSEFKRHVKGICVEIADEILEGVNNEIVTEMIEMSTPNI